MEQVRYFEDYAIGDGRKTMARTITETWRDVEHRGGDATWLAHEDINAVMLATALEPSGYLELC